MAKTRKWRDLYDKISPERRSAIEKRVEQSMKEMPIHELRAARRLTQRQLAQTLGMTQPAVSQIEHSTDLYLSTLENFVEAMGGRLEVHAIFPDGKVKLTRTVAEDAETESE